MRKKGRNRWSENRNRTIEVKSRFKGQLGVPLTVYPLLFFFGISHRGPTLGSGAHIPANYPGGLVFSKLPGSLRHHCRACGRRLVGGSDANGRLGSGAAFGADGCSETT